MLEEIKSKLLDSELVLRIDDHGAGSRIFSGKERKVKDLAKVSSSSLKTGRLLYRIARYLKPAVMVELGTSLGFGTICLAKGNPQGKIITIEGSPALAAFSKKQFTEYQLSNIEVVSGLFDEKLPALATKLPFPELVFIDGNHDHEPTLRYVDFFASRMREGIIILDDIHWSENMHLAWQKICSSEKTHVTIDLFQTGLIFPDKSITPGHYTIRF